MKYKYKFICICPVDPRKINKEEFNCLKHARSCYWKKDQELNSFRVKQFANSYENYKEFERLTVPIPKPFLEIDDKEAA